MTAVPQRYPKTALPDLANFIRRLAHCLSRFARKSLRKFWHVDHDSVDAIDRRGMRIGLGAETQIFRTLVSAIPLGEADEEALLGSEAIYRLQVLVLGRIFPRY